MSDDVNDIDVVYFDAATAASIMASKHPVTDLNAAMVASGGPQLSNTTIYANPGDPYGGGQVVTSSVLRLYVVIMSELDSNVLRTGDLDIAHGYQTGQPKVPDSSGAATTKPGHTTGDSSTDWMDTPPPGYVATGVWHFDQHLVLGVAWYGAEFAMSLSIPSLSAVLTVGGWADVFDRGVTGGIWLDPAGTTRDASSVYAVIDPITGSPMSASTKGISATAVAVNDQSEMSAHVIVHLTATS